MTRNYTPACPPLMNQTAFRLFSKLRLDDGGDGCWGWTGGLVRGGYGQFHVGPEAGGTRRPVKAHRFLYEAIHGLVADGLQLDHLCRNPACCNPKHLEPVTPSVNVRRGLVPVRNRERAEAITHCPHGHPYDATNTWTTKTGRRVCRACARANTIIQTAKRTAARRN